jgi:hypothetical protein
MDHFAGLDVSVKETSICIVDDTGRIVREVKVASEPEALLQVLKNAAYHFKRIGLEAGPMSQWLFSALRVCRVAKHNEQSLEQTWATLKPVFDAEIAKCRDANFEFSTLSASYIANIDFMSHEWLVANVKRLFPAEYPTNFKAALGGLDYATPTRVIYQLLASNGILDAGFKAKLEDSHSRERITEWICLAYLWGDETLDTPLMGHIFAGGADDLQNAAEYFWRVHGEKLTPEQIERVLAFWAKCLEWAKKPEASPNLLSRLSRLAPYLTTLDERAKGLLLGVVPYVHTDYSTDHMVEELARLVDTNPAAIVELLERMFDANTRLITTWTTSSKACFKCFMTWATEWRYFVALRSYERRCQA